MGKKIKVGILFGGKSAEHEVSLQSAKNVYDAIDRAKYEPVLIGIDKSGRWLLNEDSEFLLDADDPKHIRLNPSSGAVALVPQSRGAIANLSNTRQVDSSAAGKNSRASPWEASIDVVFPILHGPFGEDGTVQGLLKLADIPFVGAGVLASAAGMDKDVMKRLFRDAGLPIGKFLTIHAGEKFPAYEEVCAELGSPLFIKPANMGSSVGVSKVHSRDEYLQCLKAAFEYDTKVIMEEFIQGRELECSVLGSHFAAPGEEGEIKASAVGEVKPRHEFYSYDAKYIDEHGAELVIPADIPPVIAGQARELAVKVFKTLCCEGLGRVDFFLKAPASEGGEGKIIVNEINTMPGFTRISMYPKLWEASGISYTSLIDRLIELALLRYEKEKGIKTDRD
uniref:D-alanine--D-alanine ligase n=1 Tax=uncultured bacterium contig00086 TaxID=1181559 RepID=A0A806K1E5_9BACT|nr:D-alanine--D-alanine ligase [uncultured bacterium contig00086]